MDLQKHVPPSDLQIHDFHKLEKGEGGDGCYKIKWPVGFHLLPDTEIPNSSGFRWLPSHFTFYLGTVFKWGILVPG